MKRVITSIIFIVSVILSLIWTFLPIILPDVGNFFYWILLALIITYGFISMIAADRYLYLALFLTLLGGSLSVVGLSEMADKILRIGLLLWVVGAYLVIRKTDRK